MIRYQREDLFQAINHGAVVITPNHRLCLDILNEWALSSGEVCIEHPRCLSYDGFLRDLFQRLTHESPHLDHPVLLNQHQIEHLFQAIIKTTRHGFCNEGLLQAVLQAWTFCKAWDIDLTHPSFDERPQTQQFKIWSQTFEQTLHQLNVITPDHLIDYLIHHTLEPIDTLLWHCFDATSPAQKKLQAAFEKNKTTLIYHDLPPQDRLCYQHQAEDEHQEYEHLMLWIKKKLSEGQTKIGVVLPDLAQKKANIHRRFTSHFSEEEFNISMGQPLADYPLMAHALQWIALDKTTLTQHQATLLLHSPYLAYAEQEHLLRTELFQQSPLFQEKEITYDALITLLTQQTPLLAEALETIHVFPKQASPHMWRQVFKERLLHLGFPGEITLNSLNYQCIQRINTLFDDFGALSVITPSLTQDEALHALTHLAREAIFQPEKKNAPIQLLGLLEASGCTFDCLWVMSMTDQCLPQKPRLSAFIPIALQRQYDMPHATPERELRLATQLIHRLQDASDEIIFSFPRLLEEQPNLPSPLITHLPLYNPIQVDAPRNATALRPWVETYHLPLQPHEIKRAGSHVLAHQAKCPFRAFAMQRLHVKQTPAASNGPSPLERGLLIHKILEELWRGLKTQDSLCKQSNEALDTLITQTIQSAIQPLAAQKPQSFNPLVQSVEFKRLKRLVEATLEWEKTRPTFVVEALEKSFTLTLAGLEFNLQIDRLDCMSSGKKWIIDYKSRLPTPLPWLESRPEAPQLLLYSLMDEAIRGLIFVELKQGQLTTRGLIDEDSELSDLSTLKADTPWTAVQAQWVEQLTRLAEEFQQGHCPPLPTHTRTCQTCDVQTLCRRNLSSIKQPTTPQK